MILKEITFFVEIMDIWAKEIKKRRRIASAAIHFLGRLIKKKKARKRKEKGSTLTHTKKYSSFNFLSN